MTTTETPIEPDVAEHEPPHPDEQTPTTEPTATEGTHAPAATEADREPGTDVEATNRTNQTIDRLTESVLATPGIPGRDEFVNLCLQAKLLSMSAAVPKGLRDNPHLCLHVVLIARDLGVSPATALNLIDFIPEDKHHPEKGGQLSLSPELLCAQVKRLGLGSVVLLVNTASRAVAVALEPGGRLHRDVNGEVTLIEGEIGRTEFTWEDAIAAGLVDERCALMDERGNPLHWRKPGTSGREYGDRCRCRGGYQSYPKRMMAWRSRGYCVTDWFPEASLGLYSPEELGVDVDDQGRPISPDTVELPSGYAPPPPPPKPPAEQPITEDDRALFRIDIGMLDEQGRKDLLAQWEAANMTPLGSEAFTQANHTRGRAMLRSVQTARARAGWDEGEERQRVHDYLVGLEEPAADAQAPDEPEAQASVEEPTGDAPDDQETPPATPGADAAAPEGEAPPEGDSEPQDVATAPPALPTDIPEGVVTITLQAVAKMTPTKCREALRKRQEPPKVEGEDDEALRKRTARALLIEWHRENRGGESPSPESS